MAGRIVIAGTVALAFALATPAAHAQSAPQDQYGGPGQAPGQTPPPGAGSGAGGGGGNNPGGGGGGEAGRPGNGRPGASGRPNRDGKGRDGHGVLGEHGGEVRRESGASAPLRDARGGSLPFTGADLTLLLFLGGLLVMFGAAGRAVERRLARRRR